MDDGISHAYRSGQWRRWEMTCEVSERGITIETASTGPFYPWWSEVKLVVYGVPSAPTSIAHAEAGALSMKYDVDRGTASATFANDGSGFSVTGKW